MINEAHVSLIGFIATQPTKGRTKSGLVTLTMRVGWTPRSLDKTTGEWSDLASSFATVQCYRKVAEHAAICLRKGEPVVVRGALRVREYTDKAGQRRSTVEIQADSIGHDMSRGISNYSKLPARAELTADEYEEAQAATADRDPLLGDRDQAALGGAQEADEAFDEDSELADDVDVVSGDTTELELALEDEEYDASAGDVLTGASGALDPVGVPT
jgi:single-strand DNA-binding protein